MTCPRAAFALRPRSVAALRRALVGAGLVLALAVGAAPGAQATGALADGDLAAGLGGVAARKAAVAPPAAWAAPRVAGSLLVTTTGPTSPAGLVRAAQRLGRLPGASARQLVPGVAEVRVAPGAEVQAAATLASVPGVVAVEPNARLEWQATPNDPRYGDQWAHPLADAPAAWAVATGTVRTLVGLADSGVRGDHPDLLPNLVEQVDTATGEVRPKPLGSDNDECVATSGGHGTHVAGVVGAAGDNGLGVTGTAWRVSLVDIAVDSLEAGCHGPTDAALLRALDYAVSRPGGRLDVLNMSLGSVRSACPTAMQAALDRALEAGVVLVAASGNTQQSSPGATVVPAACRGVISVGAVGRTGAAAPYSTANRHVDLAAPGGDENGGILSTSRSLDYDVKSGTSFAAPYVSGVAALVRSARPTVSPAEIESVLERTARDLGAAGRDDVHGHGLVQAGAAVNRALSAEPIPAPAPDPAFPVGDRAPVTRVAAATSPTSAVPQAVAMSRSLFAAGEAEHAIIARADDYADALAGSSLGFGLGPVLYTGSTGALSAATREELRRVLPRGGIVFLMGGTAALPGGLDAEVAGLGYQVRRLAGKTREETAVRTADALRQRLGELGYPPQPAVLLATRQNWPDAVAAGSIGSYFGLPVLLTPPTSLHPVTAAALQELQPQLVYVVGGTAAVSAATAAQAQEAAGLTADRVVRLGGAARDATTVAVSDEMVALLQATGRSPSAALAVNLRRRDGYAHVLSATAYTGAYGGVFVPVEQSGGTSVLTPVARQLACRVGGLGIVVGGPDLVSTATERELSELLAGDAGACG